MTTFMYRKFRSVLKRLYFLVKGMIPAAAFLSLGLRSMYLINSLSVRTYKSRYGFRGIGELPRSLKRSDTLFILGSGGTINEYTSEQWRKIAECDSVGFNFWLFHEFTPTFYVYEENLDPKRNSLFYQALIKKKKSYEGIPLIVKDIEYKGVSAEEIPLELKDQVYLSTDITVGCSEEELELFFKKGHKYMNMMNQHGLKVVLKKSGTLSYLIFMAEQMGYRNIVLCGVDLNNSAYFYDVPKYHAEFEIPTNYENKKEAHPTNQQINGNVPIDKIIFTINDNILSPQGIKLYVGSTSSALYPALPYYFEADSKGL